jgi:PIN domain nuclease of toxin-antitoxin system
MKGNSYLLDTHCLLWFQENNPKIPKKVMQKIQDKSNKIFFSQISLFEISIKKKIGKLPDLKVGIKEISNQAIADGFTFLNIKNEHLFHYEKVPLFEIHRDPFDRLLIATAAFEKSIIITADKNFNLYPEKLVEIFW